MLVAFTHWHYMSLRLLDRADDARAVLDPIHEDMNVIESMPYHQLCLLYKGENDTGTVLDSNITAAGGDSAMYGIANWHYYNGDPEEGLRRMRAHLESDSWAAFGYIAAEADVAAKR